MSTTTTHDPECIHIYTDGACSGNPGLGGWGCLIMFGSHYKMYSGSDPYTTNNRMELQAAIEGIKRIKQNDPKKWKIILYSDSAYLVNAFNKQWLNKWVKNNWFKDAKQKEPVLNDDLWKEIWNLANTYSITWEKVKGHADNPYNNLCDEMATRMIKYMKECKTKL